MNNDTRSHLQMIPALRFAIFFVVTGISLILGGLISFSVAAFVLHVPFNDLSIAIFDPKNANMLLFINALTIIISFLIPSVTVAYFTKGSIASNMGFKKIGHFKQIGWVIILSLLGLYLSGALSTLTQMIPIPNNLNAWASNLEDSYKKGMGGVMHMKSINDLIAILILVALIPAIFEELYFRGGLQKTIKDWSGMPVLSIVITAIIFSAFHFSFFGFLSRMALGIVLGFIFEYTKSIWLSILMHFLNNGIAVVGLYLVRNNLQKMSQAMDDNGAPLYLGAVALIFIIYFLRLLNNKKSDSIDAEKMTTRKIEDWKKVYSSPNLSSATIIASILEENQIPVKVLNRKDSAYVLMGEAEVYVLSEFIDKATALIAVKG
jgi:membrane protease YdiL (CAAX protease family)